MCPVALTPHETWEVQFPGDWVEVEKDGKKERRPDPAGTWFRLRALSVRDEAEVKDSLPQYDMNGRGVQVTGLNLGTQELEVLRRGLVGVRQFRDERGAEVEFKTERVGGRDLVSMEFLERLAPEVRRWLAQAIDARLRVPLASSD